MSKTSADDGVTVTEKDGVVSIEIITRSVVTFPREVLESNPGFSVGAMVLERMENDCQMDRDGTDPYFVPAIDKAIAKHLDATNIMPEAAVPEHWTRDGEPKPGNPLLDLASDAPLKPACPLNPGDEGCETCQ